MRTTKKLHELIELAKIGKKFEATIVGKDDTLTVFSEKTILNTFNWSQEAITANWIYKEIREPLRFEADIQVFSYISGGVEITMLSPQIPTEYNGKKFYMTLVEKLDE